MARRIFIYPYNQYSASAKALGFRRIKRENSQYRSRDSDLIINWGCSSDLGFLYQAEVLNNHQVVTNARNKLTCLETLAENAVSVVPFTTDSGEAKRWLETGHRVFARTTLTGHSGAGIIDLYGRDIEVPNAPLYTKYIKKRYEFRVHVYNWSRENLEGILVTQKVARPGAEPTNWRIRNHNNGFIFQTPNIPGLVWDAITAEAFATLDALELDFGAVDIIWNDHQQQAYVLEVNTAPGLTGRTIDFYRNAFERF